MKTSQPSAPDPAATAAAQGAINEKTAKTQAQLNMVDQYGPGGSVQYKQIGTWEDGTPRFSVTQGLDATQQGLYDKTNDIYGTGLDTAKNLFSQLQGTLGTAAPQFDENYRQKQLANILSRTQGERDRQRESLRTQLANSGAVEGSPAYNNAFDEFNRSQNDYLLGADINAGNEARNAYATQLSGRSQGINELTGLLGLGQVQGLSPVNTPQTGVAPTDITGPTYAAYNAQMQNRGNPALGALAGLGGAALGGWGTSGFKKFW